jgi:hypothetical protein
MNQTEQAREFDLYLREGQSRFFWRLKNHGISVSGDGLTWEFDGYPRKRKFAEILFVHLSSGHVARHGEFYACQIVFRDGGSLTVQSTTDMGLPDDGRAPVYGDFVRTLHEQIARSGAKDIGFRAGMSASKRNFAVAVLAVAALFFIVLPLGIFFFLEASWHVLGLLAAGAGLVWPVWKQIEANSPRDYAPDDLPHELVP